MAKVKIEQMKERVSRIFKKAGFSDDHADVITEVLTDTELKGLKTHGYLRVSRYVNCVRGGGINPAGEMKILNDLPSLAHIDAAGVHGIVASYTAMKMAIEKAKNTGVGVVSVRGSRHFGAAGYYTAMCADENMLGISMSNGNAMIAATGSREINIGNNPMSYAAPAGKYGTILYDIAMSVGSDMKIMEMKRKGQSVPDGWMIDGEGRPSNNPNDYLNGGVLLPFGGYKGYGLALMVECFGAALSGASMTREASAWCSGADDTRDVGQFFMAIDISRFEEVARYNKRVETMIDELKASKLAQGFDRIYYPGEKELVLRAERLASGELEVDDATLATIAETEKELGI